MSALTAWQVGGLFSFPLFKMLDRRGLDTGLQAAVGHCACACQIIDRSLLEHPVTVAIVARASTDN